MTDLEKWLESASVTELRDYIRTTERVLEERNRLLEAIPECPVHGKQCVPHAIEWVERAIADAR